MDSDLKWGGQKRLCKITQDRYIFKYRAHCQKLFSVFRILTSLADAVKSLQSCRTLCDPIDGSPLGSSLPGILQATSLGASIKHFFKEKSQSLQSGLALSYLTISKIYLFLSKGSGRFLENMMRRDKGVGEAAARNQVIQPCPQGSTTGDMYTSIEHLQPEGIGTVYKDVAQYIVATKAKTKGRGSLCTP